MSSSEVFVWVNASELMQFLPNLPKCKEPSSIKNLHMLKDHYCVRCKMNNYVDLSRLKPIFVDGYLFISCADIRKLTSNGFVTECVYVPEDELMPPPSYSSTVERLRQYSYQPRQENQSSFKKDEPTDFLVIHRSEHFRSAPSPYPMAPNPYETHQSFIVKQPSRFVPTTTQDDIEKERRLRIERERHLRYREAICRQLSSICEDKSSVLYGLIHMAYVDSVHSYGPDAIHRVPGGIYYMIINNFIMCGRFMNKEILNIFTILSIIDDVKETITLKSYCKTLIEMWTKIEHWIKSINKEPAEVFNDLTPKMYEYIEYFQDFALVYNRSKINAEPLSAVSLIEEFINKNSI